MNAKKTDDARPYDQLIYTNRMLDLAEFERNARLAKDAGFTHLEISWMNALTDFQGDDVDSPWCEWSVISPSLFKHVTPPGLEDAYPAEFVAGQMAWLKAKHAICEKLGMKAAYYGNEPHWLSERVYAKHPDWRGSRCDNSLRTSGMFFSPNMDHPEVREAYRAAIQMLVEACPLLDTFYLMDNDSGSGFTWGGRLYVNPNGPTGYENVDMGTRTIEWMRAMRQGALDGGCAEPRFFQLGWLTAHELNLIRRSAEPGLGLMYRHPDNSELVGECTLGVAGTWGGHGSWWALLEETPTPFAVLNAAATIRTSPVRRFFAYGESSSYFPAFKAAMTEPPATCQRTSVQVLAKMAEAVYGSPNTDNIVDAWYLLRDADLVGGHLTHGLDQLRWLVRPLVAHQDRLTADERSYWEPYIYQSEKTQPETYLDYLNHSGYRMATCWDNATPLCIAIDRVAATLDNAAAKLEAARDEAPDEASRQRLQNEVYRVRARRCCQLTVRHFLQMGTLIYEREAQAAEREAKGIPMTSTRPERPDLAHGNMGSTGLFFMHRTMRWELDNVNDLIRLIEQSPVPLIHTAPRDDMQCSFLIGADLLDQLKKKVRIMLKHWREAEIGWYRPTLGG